MKGPLVLGWLLLLATGRLEAQGQDSLATPAADSVVPVDTVPAAPAPDTLTYPKAPVSPMGALLRSFLVPGWGQAKLHRKLTGALFVTWEGVTLGMALKTDHELQYLRRTRSGSIKSKEQERQDWLVLLAFNHLFSGIEAYVSSHLWDFPEDLQVSAAPLPDGGFGASIRVPFRLP
ncbi:MAG: hypothetical protein ABI742_13355 [Gemmatimonadota bacterium]